MCDIFLRAACKCRTHDPSSSIVLSLASLSLSMTSRSLTSWLFCSVDLRNASCTEFSRVTAFSALLCNFKCASFSSRCSSPLSLRAIVSSAASEAFSCSMALIRSWSCTTIAFSACLSHARASLSSATRAAFFAVSTATSFFITSSSFSKVNIFFFWASDLCLSSCS